MTDHRKFQLVGTKAELESFLRQLEYTPDIEVLKKTEVDIPASQSDSLGNAALISYVVEFGIGVGAHASWDVVKWEFDRFRRGRPHLALSPLSESSNSESPGGAPADGTDALVPTENLAEPSHENLSE